MDDILKGAIGSGIVVVLTAIFSWLRARFSLALSQRDPRLPSVFLYLLLAAWLAAGVVLNYDWIVADGGLLWMLPIFSVWSLAIVFHFWRRRQELRTVGVRGADREIRQGIDYKRALSLCKTRLKFLGTGADKLTKEVELEKAVARCPAERPVMFLLCEPTHDCLEDAAKRFGVDREEYKKRVINSLRRLAALKNRFANIEVRFYPEFQIFRLMFIDDAVCLFSYNVMGKGDGSQLPQLHIVKPLGSDETLSFYNPLERYFDDLWERSREWDFHEYLKDE